MPLSQSEDSSMQGSCACGRITFTATASSAEAGSTICHCSQCRKLSGSAFQVFFGLPSKDILWLDQAAHLKFEGLPTRSLEGVKLIRLSDKADRAMCGDCGSCLAMRYDFQREKTYVTMGCVDQERLSPSMLTKLTPNEQIFCGEQASWLQLGHSEHRIFAKMPPAMEKHM